MPFRANPLLHGALRRALDAMAWSARRGSVLLAVGIFGGVAAPPVATAFKQFVAPDVLGLMTLVLLRVDLARTVFHLRRPWRVVLLVLFQMVACPVVVWLVTLWLPLGAGIAAGCVLFATGPAAVSSPAFARMVGLDAELSLLATLLMLVVVPFTAPPIALELMNLDLSIGTGALMGRLLLTVGVPVAVSLGLRRLIGVARLDRWGDAVDGALVWLVVFYGFAVMDGLQARVAADPAWVVQALVAAFAVDYGLNLVTAGSFAGMGRVPAATAGLMSGNRNMALYLAVLPGSTDPRITLFFGLCQFPLFLSPFLLRPVYRQVLAGRRGDARSPP